jgi:hypothetical protein
MTIKKELLEIAIPTFRGLGHLCGVATVFYVGTYFLYETPLQPIGAIVIAILYLTILFSYYKIMSISFLFFIVDLFGSFLLGSLLLVLAIVVHILSKQNISLIEIAIVVVTIVLYLFYRPLKKKSDDKILKLNKNAA